MYDVRITLFKNFLFLALRLTFQRAPCVQNYLIFLNIFVNPVQSIRVEKEDMIQWPEKPN
jgi:hypothetical protein